MDKKILDGARIIIRTCLNVKPNERVLIITDTGRDLQVAQAIFQASVEAKSIPVIAVMTERTFAGEEPPPQIIEAMKSSDAIACPTTTTMYHTNARIEACKNGARLIAMTGATPETLRSNAMRADFVKQRVTVEKFARLITEAKTIRLTTKSGTNLTANIEGRVANAESGLCHESGRCVGVPDIEVNISPIEESIEGKLVVDGSISVIPGLLKRRVELSVTRGRVTEIRGGSEATKLEKILEETNSPNAYVVAEFGIGLNPKAKLKGTIIEDEASLGTAHVALGDNHRMGGKNIAPTHIDMVILKPTVELDSKVIYKVNKLLT